MMTNLAQLKRSAAVGAVFEVVAHWRTDFVGQVRQITKSSTSGMYAAVLGQPDHMVSRENDGKGYYIKWGSASNWEFENGVCSLFRNGKTHTEESFVMSIQFKGGAV